MTKTKFNKTTMSSFIKETKNPRTKKMEKAEWLDDYFGHRIYGIRFPDGRVYEEDELEKLNNNKRSWDDLKNDKEQKNIYRDNARFVAEVNHDKKLKKT